MLSNVRNSDSVELAYQISTTDAYQVTFSKVLLILTTGTHASENRREKFSKISHLVQVL